MSVPLPHCILLWNGVVLIWRCFFDNWKVFCQAPRTDGKTSQFTKLRVLSRRSYKWSVELFLWWPLFRPFYVCYGACVCSVIRYVQRPTGQVPPVRTQSHRGRKKLPVPPLFTNVTRNQKTLDAVPAKFTFIAAFHSSVFTLACLFLAILKPFCVIAFSDSEPFFVWLFLCECLLYHSF